MAIETADEFVRSLHECVRIAPPDNAYFAPDETQRRVETRDAAVARAAKLELLDEIRSYASACPGAGDERYRALLSFLDTKYGAAKGPG